MNNKSSVITTLFLSITLLSACTEKTDTVSIEPSVQSKPQSTSPVKPVFAETQLQGTWQVESIENKPVIDRSPARFVFTDKQQVSGSASCNNFSTAYKIKNQQLIISPVAVTRKMCAPVLMNQENRFLAALANVKQYKLEHDMLYLLNKEKMVVFKASKLMSK